MWALFPSFSHWLPEWLRPSDEESSTPILTARDEGDLAVTRDHHGERQVTTPPQPRVLFEAAQASGAQAEDEAAVGDATTPAESATPDVASGVENVAVHETPDAVGVRPPALTVDVLACPGSAGSLLAAAEAGANRRPVARTIGHRRSAAVDAAVLEASVGRSCLVGPGARKRKRVSWASDDALCKVHQFERDWREGDTKPAGRPALECWPDSKRARVTAAAAAGVAVGPAAPAAEDGRTEKLAHVHAQRSPLGSGGGREAGREPGVSLQLHYTMRQRWGQRGVRAPLPRPPIVPLTAPPSTEERAAPRARAGTEQLRVQTAPAAVQLFRSSRDSSGEPSRGRLAAASAAR